MAKSIFLVGCLLLALSLPIDSFAQCGCNFTIDPGAGNINFDGVSNGVKPGDVICLSAGLRGKISFTNIRGSADRYVTVKNCGGKTEVGGPNSSNAISFYGSRYFRLTGTGQSGIDYGIKIIESKSGSQGVVCSGLSSDFEIDHLEIQKAGFAGIMAKTDPACDNSSTRPNFTMYNVRIHDNYFHEITGEGIYLGNSFYSGTSQYCGVMQYCHEVRGVRVYNNIVDGSGWEAIQIGAAVSDVEVYNNRVYNYGTQNRSAQNGGIQLGSGSTGRVYNNLIKNGTGPGFWIQGIGNLYFYNNIVINPGFEAFNVNVRPTPLPTDIVPSGFLGGVYILNNTVVSASYAAIRENINNAPGNVFSNNLIVNSASNWNQLKTYTDWKQENNLVIQNLADAKFTNAGADDYSLQPSSPAINAGIDLRSFGVTIDHKYATRPQGGRFDVGAFEFSGGGPQTNAGGDKTITLPVNTVSLAGTGSSTNGSITSWVWTKKSGGAATLQNANSATLTVVDLVQGVYEFQLEVTDNAGMKATSIAKVTVIAPSNQAPTANAGSNRTISLPTNTLVLNGSGFDADGTITAYEWTKLNGPNCVLSGQTTPNLQITELTAGVYVFQLKVTDDKNATGLASVTITVNAAPVNQLPTVNAGADISIYLPINTVNITAQAADNDGSIKSYLWEKRSGPAATITNTTTTTVTADNLLAGVYIFRITVTDNVEAVAFDEVQVNVIQANQPPVAAAGADITITLPQNTVTLNGNGSDTDGSVTTYSWSKVTSLQGNIVSPNQASTVIDQLVQGSHKFGLTVTDDDGATAYDEVTVNVNAAPVNARPTVNAGADRNIQLPTNNITLNGTANDSDGTITTIQWSKVSGPAATLSNENTLSLQVTNMVAGTYVFSLRVTDNGNSSANDNVQVVVFPASINQPPVANAGGNKLISLPDNSITLAGTGSDPDGTIAEYEWSQESGPASTINASGGTLNVTNMLEGVYVFRLVVTDDKGATDSDFATVSVVASNLAPIINEPVEQTVKLPATTTEVTTVARDPDGTITNYAWTQTAGPPANLNNTSSATLAVSGLQVGDYVFQVVVTDNDGSTTTANYRIKVIPDDSNVPPLAAAGNDDSIFLPTNSVTLRGSGTDNDGTITSYAWTLVSGNGNIVSPSSATTVVNNLTLGIHVFRLTVTDDQGDTDTDEVEIIVNPEPSNRRPIVFGGGNRNIQLPTRTITLAGRASDPDGTVTSYTWSQLSGPRVTIRTANRAVTTIDGLVEGRYVFRLLVTDNDGASAFDVVTVTVLPAGLNQAPIVHAGSNQSIILPTNLTNLTGVASDDGTVTSYRWTKQTGPAATLTNDTNPVATLRDLVEGSYVYRLTVFDNDGASSYDEVQITVSAAGANVTPIANAGGNQSILLPTNTINMYGSGTDQDGMITAYRWIKTSGGPAALENAGNPVLTVKGLEAGSYTFRLTVTDDAGASNQDFATVIVIAPVNLPPIVNAGVDQTLYLPNNTTTLTGDATDPDGTIAETQWTQRQGATVALTTTSEKNLLLRALDAGSRVFRLTATDNSGASAFDEASVTVVPAPNNLPPTVDAGDDVQLYLPLAEYIITGTASDPDGTINTYTWIKVEGPPVTMSNVNTESLTISNFAAGTYRFRLQVADNESKESADEIIVTVLPATVNRAPVVSLQSRVELTLPNKDVTIKATAKDNDGTIASVSWTQISGAAATASGTSTETLSLTDLDVGSYVFRFTAVDDKGAEASAQVTITVNPVPPNQAPVVNAGLNQNVIVPVSLSLAGTATDSDGTIKSTMWTQIEGPSVSINSSSSLKATTQELTAAGTYVFRLTATDNEDATGFSDVTIYARTEEQSLTPKADFITFAVPNQTKASVIDTVKNTVDAEAKILNNSYRMLPQFELSRGAVAKVNGVIQVSGLNEHDFTTPLNYSVMASDSVTEKIWNVSVAGVLPGPDPNSNPNPTTGEPVYPLFFSPNSDGQNDTWAIGNFAAIGTCTLEVFARNGQLVYRNGQFDNHWDGTWSGRPVVSGDYYYLITKQGSQVSSGSLRIIR